MDGLDFGMCQSRDAHLRAAEAALSLGNTSIAIERAEAVIAMDPTHLPGLEVLAKAIWQVGDLPRVAGICETMIRLNPYEPGYFALLGAAYQSLGRVGSAIAALSRSVELDGGAEKSVVAMLSGLRRFQADLIAELLHEDALFRTQYRRDPIEACRARGFEIDPPAQAVVRSETSQPSRAVSRPS